MSNLLNSAVATIIALAAGCAQAGTISDGYLGGTGGGSTIGGSTYNLTEATITRVGTVLNVAISTSFAGNAQTVGTRPVGYGDLFLSNVWSPSGSAATGYATDNMSNSGTIWKYGVNIKGDTARYANAGLVKQDVTLYDMGAGNNVGATAINAANITTSTGIYNGSGVSYRAGQADIVNTTSGNLLVKSSTATNPYDYFTAANNLVTFQIDMKGTDMINWTSFAMHWGDTTQTYAIEGITRVPEPGSLALFGLAAAGLIAARRRKMI